MNIEGKQGKPRRYIREVQDLSLIRDPMNL